MVNAAEIIGKPIVTKLWLFNKKRGCPLRSEVKVDLSDCEKENLNRVNPVIKRYREHVHGRFYDSKDGRWVSFDVSQLIEKVLRNVKDVCKSMDTEKLTVTVNTLKCSSPEEEIQNPRQAYLEILPIAPSTPLECTPGETRCCRQATIVPLAQLVPNIIVPRNVRAFYCRGTCDGGLRNGPCCVPTKTMPLTVLSIQQGRSIVKSDISRALVEQCGCR